MMCRGTQPARQGFADQPPTEATADIFQIRPSPHDIHGLPRRRTTTTSLRPTSTTCLVGQRKAKGGGRILRCTEGKRLSLQTSSKGGVDQVVL